MRSKLRFNELPHASAEGGGYRNLGATAATWEGHGEGYGVGCLYYQYGRKTPYARTLGTTLANTVAAQQTFAYTVKNPLIFVTGSANWTNQDTSTSYMYNDKNVAAGSDGKSIFDPSPIGWRLPINGTFSDFPANCTGISDNVATYSAASATYPATGRRSEATSAVTSAGSDARLYTSTPSSTTNAYYLQISTSSAGPGSYCRTRGYSLRAIRE